MKYKFVLVLFVLIVIAYTGNAYVKGKSQKRPPHVLLTSTTIFQEVELSSILTDDPSSEKHELRIIKKNDGQVIALDEERRPSQSYYFLSSKITAVSIGHNRHLYLSDGSRVRELDENGQEVKSFHAPATNSLATLSDGSLVLPWSPGKQAIHMYSREGYWKNSFGKTKLFDVRNVRQNEFLNQGHVLVDNLDNIYFVSIFAPVPFVQKYSKEGVLIREFKIEGAAVDLQADLAIKYLNNKSVDDVGGRHIITSASIDPATGHLWLGLNGSNKTAIIYEYDGEGDKLGEYSLMVKVAESQMIIAGVKDLLVKSPSLLAVTWDNKVYKFDLTEGKLIGKNSINKENRFAQKVASLFSGNPVHYSNNFISPTVLASQGFPGCATAQTPQTCSINCATGGTKDCMTAITNSLSTDLRKTASSCTITQSSPTSPGGCNASLTTCSSTGEVVVHTNSQQCTACSPTGTPPQQTPPCTWNVGQCKWDCPNPQSPILLDLGGNGFDLTDLANGVKFDLDGDGRKQQLSWTSAGVDNGWLCLDRNMNGTIDNGIELFGNFTPQPPSTSPNGFVALAEYDKSANGGNGDGLIDSRDAVFSSLRLWVDANHNGISEPNELFTLQVRGVTEISLDYKESKRRDEYGNEFRYWSKVSSASNFPVGRKAYDVFLLSQ